MNLSWVGFLSFISSFKNVTINCTELFTGVFSIWGFSSFFFEGIYFSKEYFLKICETKHSWILSVSTTTDPHSINKCFFFLYQLIHKLLIFFEESITEASFYKTLTISLWVLLVGSWISSSFSGRGSLLCPFTLTPFFSTKYENLLSLIDKPS